MKGRSLFRVLSSIASLAMIVGCAQGAAPAPVSPATPQVAAPRSPQPGTTAPTPTLVTKTPSEKPPKTGGVLKDVIGGDPPNLTPLFTTTMTIHSVAGAVYNSLVKWDPKSPQAGKTTIVPDLAESWEISGDGTLITFQIRKGVKWHDGAPLTAEDIKWNLELRAFPLKGVASMIGGATFADAIKKVETVGDSSVKVTLKGPRAGFLDTLASGAVLMVPKHIADKEGLAAFDKKMIGTGPWVLKEYMPGVKHSLTKNPNYFKKGLPYMDGIEIYIMPSAPTRTASFRAKQIDGIFHYPGFAPISQLDKVKAEFPEMGQWTLNSGWVDVNFNWKDLQPPFKDVRVRTAMSLAIDRQEAIQAHTEKGLEGDLFVRTSPWALPDEEWNKLPGYAKTGGAKAPDIAEAKKLLAEAGYPNGFKAEMIIRNIAEYENPAVVIKSNLAKVGIALEIKAIEYSTYLKNAREGQYQLNLSTSGIYSGLPGEIIGEFLTAAGHWDRSWYSNPEVDRLYSEEEAEVDLAKRKQLIYRITNKVLKEDVARISIFNAGRTNIWHQWVKNYYGRFFKHSALLFEEVWLDR